MRKNFKGKVLAVVRRIPRGKVLTYKEVARRAGSPRAYRAVGNIEPISKVHSRPRCEKFLRNARRGEESVPMGTPTKLQRGILQKQPQPFGIGPISAIPLSLRTRSAAGGTPSSLLLGLARNWPLSRPEVLLRWVPNKNRDPKIPCHRVIRSDGSIGGYNRGEREKIKILKREGVWQ